MMGGEDFGEDDDAGYGGAGGDEVGQEADSLIQE